MKPGGRRQCFDQAGRQAVRRNHVETNTGNQRHIGPAGRLGLTVHVLEHLDFAGDVEVMDVAGQAGAEHRPAGLRKGPGAVQHQPVPGKVGAHRGLVVQGEHPAVEAQFGPQGVYAAFAPARQGRAEAAANRLPGHEFAGVVVAVGPEVRRFVGGERVTTPFVNGCGSCPECLAGDEQVCRAQTQPGFTHWGSFAQLVVVHRADLNLVPLPDSLDFVSAASLGCRLVTAFRALVDQAALQPGEWVAVQGCGGVGLSAVVIAAAMGARVVAVDVDGAALARARSLGTNSRSGSPGTGPSSGRW